MKTITMQALMELIRSDKPKNVILDTDTFNEADDQFCLAYCMRSTDKINLLSVNAAPFFNSNSTSAADGMEKSYREIFKVIKLTDPNADYPVYRGSTDFLKNKTIPMESDAANNIINTVMNSQEPVIIVAIGAITNVASALIKCPQLAERTAVIWLGGHALHYPHSKEFNMRQDVLASQVVFDSGIPLIHVPCAGVCTEFITTVAELEAYIDQKNELCSYLVENVRKEASYASSRIIWDVTAAAVLTVPSAFEIVQIPRPMVTAESNYAFDSARPHYGYVRRLKRDVIYGDLFRKLAK
ncbi:MAG: nucleoside hydrolase [Clostridia bacterium]|nr:nucleoside hydrolase [Clostridia bacterium]